LAGTTRCNISTKKFGPPRSEKLGAVRITPRGIGEEQEAFLLLPLGFGGGTAASCTRKSIAVSLRCGGGHGNDEGGLLGEYVEKYRVMVRFE
jgi:hypothetical protein